MNLYKLRQDEWEDFIRTQKHQIASPEKDETIALDGSVGESGRTALVVDDDINRTIDSELRNTSLLISDKWLDHEASAITMAAADDLQKSKRKKVK